MASRATGTSSSRRNRTEAAAALSGLDSLATAADDAECVAPGAGFSSRSCCCAAAVLVLIALLLIVVGVEEEGAAVESTCGGASFPSVPRPRASARRTLWMR